MEGMRERVKRNEEGWNENKNECVCVCVRERERFLF